MACRETKLEGCADSIKTNTCYRHGQSISSLTASPPLRLEHRFRPVQAKGFGAAGHSACVADSSATLRNITCGALVLNVVIATGTHGHGHVSTHVRWLYNLIRVANAAAVFDGFVSGPSTRAVSPIAEWLGGFLVTCSCRSGAIGERDERTHSQAGVLIILLRRSGEVRAPRLF